MTTMSKFALGLMGKLRPLPSLGDAAPVLTLPPPDRLGGLPLMEALAARRSRREYKRDNLPRQLLSNLLWAAGGVNRDGGGRTAPSALGSHEIDIFAALPTGAYRYDAARHELQLAAGADLRRVTGYQDFVDDAPLDLVYVVNQARMGFIPAGRREAYAHVAAGAMAQNVYLYTASSGLGAVLRAWIDREAIADALGLTHDQQVLLSQTVGYPAAA